MILKEKTMKIGIVGSRKRNNIADYTLVRLKFFEIYKEGDIIISGGCYAGGDAFAEQLAKNYGIPIRIYPANWTKLGKSAGFQRNTIVAQESDILIACVAEDRKGGTEDTIKKFLKIKDKQNLYLV
jgi:hypothetical protein